MADIEKLQWKHRLFEDGQMLVTKREVTAYEDGLALSIHARTSYIPAKTPLLVVSEGTSKSESGMSSSRTPITMRSIKVLVVHGDNPSPKVKRIMLNPLYGPKDLARLFTFGPKEQE